MDVEHYNVRPVEEDRLSSLPDELIHKILYSFDMKFVVQTCLLSSRWKLLWTSMPCLNFSSGEFDSLLKFAEFVTHVLSHRNHQIELSSVKLDFDGEANEDFMSKITDYAFSHNVQELTVITWPRSLDKSYPSNLFRSQSLKHFTLTVEEISSSWFSWFTLDTPLDFPALTTMHLSNIGLLGELFSKCVNLNNLTLEDFFVDDMEVLDIITPRHSSLMLIRGNNVEVINLIAPQLENLTIIDCFSIECLNAPPELLSLWCEGYSPMQLSKKGFHSLNKVTICLTLDWSAMAYRRELAHNIINILQQLHSARYLTFSAYVIECLSSFPDLLSPHSSPFSNLISLTMDTSMENDAYEVELSIEARKFLLENSPSAKVILELPKGLK